MFNFDKAIAEAKEGLKSNHVGAIVLGPSGSGKSSLLGTFGVKTLYLYGTGEDHGPKAARALGDANIVPVCIDQDEGKTLAPDEVFKRLIDILSNREGIKKAGFGAIALDGATELESIIRSTTKWKQLCTTDKGKHNGFAEPAATLQMFKPIIDGLKHLQRELGIQYAMTCILDVKQMAENGELLESSPRLVGYSVAEGLIQQFPDVLVVGRMVKGDKISHRIQFLAGVSKQAKDLAGQVKKSINFTPRLTGVKELPNTLDADLTKVAELKTGSK